MRNALIADAINNIRLSLQRHVHERPLTQNLAVALNQRCTPFMRVHQLEGGNHDALHQVVVLVETNDESIPYNRDAVHTAGGQCRAIRESLFAKMLQ